MSDFEFPPTDKRTKKPTAKAAEPEVKVEEQVQETNAELKQSPAKKEYDKDELARIFDEVLFTGEYSEEVVIKGKLKVRFKTRNAEELSQISRVIDGTSFTLMQTLHESRMLLNLQYALIEYHGKDLSSFKTEERAKFVNKLAGPVVGALITALGEFDAKVATACQDIEENF